MQGAGTYCANDPVRYVDPSGHVTMYNSAGKPCEVDPREVGGAEQVGFTLTAPSVTMYKVADVSVWNAVSAVPPSRLTA